MELPPPAMKQQVRNLSVQQDINVLKGAAASDAFGPRSAALQALREFMESEQRRARRRWIALASGLGVAMLLLVLAGGLVALRVSGTAAAGRAAIQTELTDTRKEVQALRKDVETRWSQWESEAGGFRKSLAEAQASFNALQRQLTSALDGLDESGASPVLALLQELPVLRSEQLDLETRQAYLQHEMAQLEEGRRARETRRLALMQEREALARDVEAFAQRQQAAEQQLQVLPEAPSDAPDAKAVVGRSRKASSPPAAAPAYTVVEALEKLYLLRSEQLDLRARQALLQRDLDAWEAEQRLGELRQQRVEEIRTRLAGQLEAFRARQQDLQQRVDALRNPAAVPPDALAPELLPLP